MCSSLGVKGGLLVPGEIVFYHVDLSRLTLFILEPLNPVRILAMAARTWISFGDPMTHD